MTKKKAAGKKPAPSLAPTRRTGSTASLPGLENPVIEELSTAALSYRNAQDEVAEAKERLEEADEKIQRLLASHKLTRYRDSEHRLLVELAVGKTRVKVLHDEDVE